ncbi:MAG: LuxR family transcriptional regulator, partial [Anaerolineae bacterium]|nr:LuxR family transcriptional regulator [Anaerolineae bacterium]
MPRLLRTKLYIPPIRPEWIPRPRLMAQLGEGLKCKLTLLSAPAGFGKTTLLAAWCAAAQRPSPGASSVGDSQLPDAPSLTPPASVVWLSLDEEDNDPVRFWTHLVTALRQSPAAFGKAALAMLEAPQPPPIQVLVSSLLNEIVETAKPLLMVLDDLHCIDDPPVHESLTFLLDHLPPHAHLVVSSRSDPPWPLARLRAQGEMVELRTRDLRFTLGEAAAFLNDWTDLDLSDEEIAALDARTEGWVAGLQLAAISMQGRNPDAFIRAFCGSHRFVLDYLIEEVLDRQPPDIQSFLLHTAILDRLTAPLCAAVLDVRLPHSQKALAYLESHNLFLVPLDDERRWYRYHHLFAELLRAQLEQHAFDLVPVLHSRASTWYEQHDLIAEAVNHALAAQDIGRVAQLLDRNALAVVKHGESAKLLRWLGELPEEVVQAHPWLCIAYAWALVYAGHLQEAEPLLHAAEQSFVVETVAAEESQHVAGHAAAIRSYTAYLEGNWAAAAESARQALCDLPLEDSSARSFVATTLSTALRLQGNFQAAGEAFAEAVQSSRAAHDGHVAVTALAGLAGLQTVQGQLHNAADTCREALRLADGHYRRTGRRLLAAGAAHARMSLVQCEWNNLQAAIAHAREGVELSRQGGVAENWADNACFLAIALQAAGDTAGADRALLECRPIVSRLSDWYAETLDIMEAGIRLDQGNLPAAIRLAEDLSPPNLVAARVRLAQGRWDQALRMLEQLERAFEDEGAMRYWIQSLALQAVAWQGAGQIERALGVLERALVVAEPEGYVRSFIRQGPPMGQLLHLAAAQGIAAGYVGRLLTALMAGVEAAPAGPTLAALAEPLSDRELEVLRLLGTHLSAPEIAR